jgi:gluconolactonase
MLTIGMRNDFVVHDPRFTALVPINAWVEKLYSGAMWAEGPVYFGDADMLLFSDIPNNRMLRWAPDGVGPGRVSEFRRPSNHSNGNTRDRQGRLVSCEHSGRRVSRTEHDGRITTLVDSYAGKRLNSPNDVVVKADGSVWFTDPSYGIMSDYEGFQAEPEYGGANVFCLDLEGKLAVVADDFMQPNGIAFSPDESRLYVADTGGSHRPGGPHHIRVFELAADGRPRGGEVFATISPGLADGLRLDTAGNVWTSAGDGVHCYAPDGTLLGTILVPEVVSNLAFGGPRRNRLFITATSSLYACYVTARGAQRP